MVQISFTHFFSDERQRHRNSVCTILATAVGLVEFLICADYDAKISIWEITEKRQTHSAVDSQIYTQIRTVIDNSENDFENPTVIF
jgi:hypothetical protein